MDIDMPHVDGIAGVVLIRKQFKDVKILMQTVFEDNEDASTPSSPVRTATS